MSATVITPLPPATSSGDYSVYPRSLDIPTNMRHPGVMSDTSLAIECFVNQRFSAKLQAFLISYNNSIYSEHPVYAI